MFDMYETPRLENAYRKFANTMHVEHWFKAECFAPPMVRNSDGIGHVVEVTRGRQPIWYLPIIQLEYRPMERLKMSDRLDFSLIYCGKSYPKIEPHTVMDLERIARKKPKRDWRVELISAFESLTYQRQGRNKWVLVEIGKGFA